jgi:radical SAM protein with 4Fe4S-binding SPASM domain
MNPTRLRGGAIAPTLHAVEGREHLLVWGDQGEWLLVDEACAALLTGVAPGRTLEGCVREAVDRGLGDVAGLRESVSDIWRVLVGRGLVEGAGPTKDLATDVPRICNVTMNLTNRCNLRCAWCYNGLRKTREASAAEIMGALGRGRGALSDSASLIILGGEPFVRFDALVEVLDRASDLFRPRVLVSTNGTLVRSEYAKVLATRHVEVQVSIDSPDPAEHDRVRGPGAFERSLRGIRRLVAAGVPTILSMVYSSQTWSRFEAYLEMARRLGVQEARFIPLRLVGQGTAHREILPDQAVAFEHLLDVAARRPDLRSLLGRDYFSIMVKQCARSTKRVSCGVGAQVLFVDADGSLYPCPNHVSPAMRVGSVLEGDLATTLARSRVLRGIRETYRVERYEGCAACVFRRWCAGDCRGEVLAAGLGSSAPSLHCEELKKVHLRALWLAARRDPRLTITATDSLSC